MFKQKLYFADFFFIFISGLTNIQIYDFFYHLFYIPNCNSIFTYKYMISLRYLLFYKNYTLIIYQQLGFWNTILYLFPLIQLLKLYLSWFNSQQFVFMGLNIQHLILFRIQLNHHVEVIYKYNHKKIPQNNLIIIFISL